MELSTFVRKPFLVEGIEITDDNIEEVAEHVGDLKRKDDGSVYILVDRRLVPNVAKVYPGFYMTKMGDKVRVYSKRVFTEQFMPNDTTIQAWLDYLAGDAEAPSKVEA